MATAAAKRAAEADRARRSVNNSTTEDTGRKSVPQKADPVKIETYPIDSLIAAAVNQKHHLTTIEAAGHSRTRSVIVERVNINGEWYHRTKTTSYLYFHTRRDAVQNARTRGIRIVEYG